MIRIAVTGGIASGKSTVGTMLIARGAAVCDADQLAHAAMVGGSEVHRAVVGAFGEAILGPDGEIDRAALGRRVFAGEAARLRLNRIVHPEVSRAWNAWLAARPADCRLAAVLVPLLFEGGFAVGWDGIVCISAPRRIQMERLRACGLSAADAELRIAAQMGGCERERRSDYVLANSGSKELLRRQVERMMRDMLERA